MLAYVLYVELESWSMCCMWSWRAGVCAECGAGELEYMLYVELVFRGDRNMDPITVVSGGLV